MLCTKRFSNFTSDVSPVTDEMRCNCSSDGATAKPVAGTGGIFSFIKERMTSCVSSS